MVVITDIDTESAMSSVRYRYGWHKRIKHRISSLLHTVRPHRSSRSVGHVEEDQFGPESAPQLEGDLQQPDTKRHGSESRKKGKKVVPKEKGKEANVMEKGKGREKNGPKTARKPSGSAATATATGGSRRESETLVVPEGLEHIGHSPRAGSPTSSRTGDDHIFGKIRLTNDRHRGLFSVRSLTERWRPYKTPSHPSTPPEASTSTLSSSVDSHDRPSSSAVQRKTVGVPSYTGRFSPVVFARRASSWGDVGDYEDVLSLNSGGDDEPIGRDTIMFGAGGVVSGPACGTSTSADFKTAAASALPSTYTPREHLRIQTGDDTPYARQAQIRSQTGSPLAHMAYSSDADQRTCDEGSDDDSLGDIVAGTRYQGGPYPEGHSAGSSPVYGEPEGEEDGDEEDSDEGDVPLEVKRRRPSFTITMASPSPPSNGEPR
jgi:hypothetical protein